MSVQTTYSQAMTVKLAGMLGDMRDAVVESFKAEGGAIPFGYAVVIGADASATVKLPTSTGQGFRGIALHEQAQMQSIGGSAVSYAQYDVVNVLRRGLVWVATAGTVAADDAAYFIVSGGTAGKLSNVDDGTTDPIYSGVFRSSVTGAGLALLEINLPSGFYTFS